MTKLEKKLWKTSNSERFQMEGFYFSTKKWISHHFTMNIFFDIKNNTFPYSGYIREANYGEIDDFIFFIQIIIIE